MGSLMNIIETQLIGQHLSEFAKVLGFPVAVPSRPPEGDPDYGLDRYLAFPERGFSIVLDWNDIARCVQLFGGEEDQNYVRYAGALLPGVGFENSRAEIRHAMGPPAESRIAGGSGILGLKIRPWDWFAFEGMKVHFEYKDACDGVRMISILPIAQVR